MRLAGHVARMGGTRNIFIGKPKGKSHSDDLGVDGEIILERILGK
jgi:hypothetical protein